MQNSVHDIHGTHLFFSAVLLFETSAFYWTSSRRQGDGPPKPTPKKKQPDKPLKNLDFFLFKGKPIEEGTVDGQNPAPPRMMIIPLFIRF